MQKLIRSNESHVLMHGLSDNEAVEGILVNRRQGFDGQYMRRHDI